MRVDELRRDKIGLSSPIRRSTSTLRRNYERGRRLLSSLDYTSGPTWSYLGWVGFRNLGDEAILRAQRQQFNSHLRPFPVRDTDLIIRASARLNRTPLPSTLLLGGGTVIGRSEWLARIRQHAHYVDTQTLLVWGAGVEDPGFRADDRPSDTATLSKWRSTLAGVRHLGVRGPLSKRYLEAIGLEATVVGDPALRLFATHPRPVRPGLVYVNFAKPEATYAGNARNSTATAIAVTKALVRAGYEVKLFAMHPDDVGVLCATAREVRGVESVFAPRTVSALVDSLQEAHVVVSQRLHGNVLAAALHRPFVSVDYRPKCLDFALSVNMGDFNLREQPGIDRDIVERVDLLVADKKVRGHYLKAVADLQARLPPHA